MEIQNVLSILDQDRRDARKLPANDWQYDEHNNAPYSKKNIPQNQRRCKDPHDTRRLFHRIYYGIRKNEPYTQCPPLPGQGCPVLESQFMALFPCQQEKATRPNLSRCSTFGLARCGGNTQKPFCSVSCMAHVKQAIHPKFAFAMPNLVAKTQTTMIEAHLGADINKLQTPMKVFICGEFAHQMKSLTCLAIFPLPLEKGLPPEPGKCKCGILLCCTKHAHPLKWAAPQRPMKTHSLEIHPPWVNQSWLGDCTTGVAVWERKRLREIVRYDTVHGRFKHDVKIGEKDELIVNGNKIKCIQASREGPKALPWKDGEVYKIQ